MDRESLGYTITWVVITLMFVTLVTGFVSMFYLGPMSDVPPKIFMVFLPLWLVSHMLSEANANR